MIGEDKIEKEIWKPIKGYEGLYEVSNLGRVRSLDREIMCSNGAKHTHKGKILKLQVENLRWVTYKENMNNELTKENMRDRVFSEEWKKKISESNTGYKHSEEARKKMSEAHKGKKRGFDNPMSIMMVCIFPDGSRTEPMCQQDLMKLLKISHRTIKRLLETGEEYKPRIKNNKHLTGIKIIKIKED